MNTNSAFTGSYSEKTFRYQQFDLKQTRKFRVDQPVVEFSSDNFRLYVTTMRAINFQYDFPSFPIIHIKDHYVLMFDLTSILDPTKIVITQEQLKSH